MRYQKGCSYKLEATIYTINKLTPFTFQLSAFSYQLQSPRSVSGVGFLITSQSPRNVSGVGFLIPDS
jgi:hypothetical protein